MNFCPLGDGLHEVTSQRPLVPVDVYSRQGEYVATVLIEPQFIEPDAIILGEDVFIRRDDGRYYQVPSVVANGCHVRSGARRRV